MLHWVASGPTDKKPFIHKGNDFVGTGVIKQRVILYQNFYLKKMCFNISNIKKAGPRKKGKKKNENKKTYK